MQYLRVSYLVVKCYGCVAYLYVPQAKNLPLTTTGNFTVYGVGLAGWYINFTNVK